MLSKYKRRNEKVDPNKRQIKLQQIENLLRSNYSFQAEIDQSSKDFYEKEFLPIINQLKTECNDIFSDYILHPKTKLRNNDDEVNLAIQSLKNQIEVIKNKHSKNIEIKLENLKAKIIVIINKVNKLIYDTEAQLANFRVINDIKGERVLELDDIAGPLMLRCWRLFRWDWIFSGIRSRRCCRWSCSWGYFWSCWIRNRLNCRINWIWNL